MAFKLDKKIYFIFDVCLHYVCFYQGKEKCCNFVFWTSCKQSHSIQNLHDLYTIFSAQFKSSSEKLKVQETRLKKLLRQSKYLTHEHNGSQKRAMGTMKLHHQTTANSTCCSDVYHRKNNMKYPE